MNFGVYAGDQIGCCLSRTILQFLCNQFDFEKLLFLCGISLFHDFLNLLQFSVLAASLFNGSRHFDLIQVVFVLKGCLLFDFSRLRQLN